MSIMEVKEIPLVLEDRRVTLRFYPDDTIDTIRQYAALEFNKHPDRLFLMVNTELPADYYSSNPKHWMELFFRMSYDGKKIPLSVMETYVSQIRLNTGFTPREVTLEEWELHDDDLSVLFESDTDFQEWRLFGVPAEKSFVMPIPPSDIPMKPAQVPILQRQTLYETLHPFYVSEIKAVEVPTGASENIKRNYFPLFVENQTPSAFTSTTLEANRSRFDKLMKLKYTPHEKQSIIRAKWYIPLISTQFPTPRTRFEQIFYGMTVNPDTVPYVGYFTTRSRIQREGGKFEGTRHKFYVKDPSLKEIDPRFKSWWKGWTAITRPQRKTPTLLFYRGTSHSSFDRIAVTAKDITVDIHREKTSKKDMEELKKEALEWIESMDALMPFLDVSDISPERWELADLSVIATYSKAIEKFDMHRFHCLQGVFGYRNDTFRLLRADQTSEEITPDELQALEIFNQEDAEDTPEYLSEQMNISVEDARVIIRKIRERGEEFDYEKFFKSYPIIKFNDKEVIIRFATNLDRTLKYVDILRFVLTSNVKAVNDLCPRRLDVAAPEVAVVKQELATTEDTSLDSDFASFLGFDREEEPTSNAAAETSSALPKPKEKSMKVKPKSTRTHNYFNNRLQEFDKETFDKSIYPNKCDKPKQVVVLTEEDKQRIQSEIEDGQQYTYDSAPDTEKLALEDPDGTAVCPPYWCMKDEIPLREEQMEDDGEGNLVCPVCKGKVRTTDKLDVNEYTVIERKTAGRFTPYPNYMKKTVSGINGRKIPCCYPEERKGPSLAQKEDTTYILDPMTEVVPSLRSVFLPPDIIKKLKLTSNYEDTVRKGRLLAGKSDIFRVGLGRASKTLPTLLTDSTRILEPREAPNVLKKCSFYRTWDKKDAERTIQEAYETGNLTQLQELEYVTAFLKCEVVLVDMRSLEVSCGFWADVMTEKSRTIVVFMNGERGNLSVLTRVSRVKEVSSTKTEYAADLRKKPFVTETLPLVRALHSKACSVGTPVLSDAAEELRRRGLVDYQVILDPLKRVQALMVPNTIILPVQPSNAIVDKGKTTHDGYHEVEKTDLPTLQQVTTFLQTTIHPGYKNPTLLQDVDGNAVEVRLSSGFHIPIQRVEEQKKQKPEEVVNTIMNRETPESMLVNEAPNPADIKTAQLVAYSEEIYQFLLFSLSKDIYNGEWDELHSALVEKTKNLGSLLKKWFKKSSYVDRTQKPIEFINKIRTPCGQFENNEDSCKKSTLCGWHNNTCKIRVKSTVDPDALLQRLLKAMYTNEKQRALVIDALITPFFSTILYLEMPHELITTTV